MLNEISLNEYNRLVSSSSPSSAEGEVAESPSVLLHVGHVGLVEVSDVDVSVGGVGWERVLVMEDCSDSFESGLDVGSGSFSLLRLVEWVSVVGCLSEIVNCQLGGVSS